LTPIILKISQKIKHTNSTFIMEGMAPTKALTTTYRGEKTDWGKWAMEGKWISVFEREKLKKKRRDKKR